MATSKSPIDPEVIRALAEILKETDLTEIEVEQKDLRVRVARNIQVAAQIAMPAAAPVAVAAPAPVAAHPIAAPAKAGIPAGAVTSPMVGTAYRSPAPEKPSFIEIGTQVKQGQPLLVIEAMKTFNEIPAPRAGTVTQILVDNGQPVEFGEPLVVIE